MKEKHIFLALLLLSAPQIAASQKNDMEDPADKPASYWQLNYGVPQNAVTYNITLQTEDLNEAESAVLDLARKYDLGAANNQNLYFSHGPNNKTLSFSSDPAKAEKFAQAAVSLGKLKSFSSSKSINTSGYAEIKKKTAMIGAELENNKDSFEKLPIAKGLLTELYNRHKSFLAGYKEAMNRGAVVVNLTTKTE